MTIMRLFLAAFALLLIVGCGQKEREPVVQPSVAANAAEQRREADALFNEFFDSRPATPPPATTTPTTQQRRFTVDDLPESSPEPRRRDFTFTPTGRYVVQVSTVANPELARSVARRFESMGYPAYVAQVENPTTSLIGTFFRVRIGGFNRVSEARNFGEDVLRPLGYDFWVDNRSNDNIGIGGMGLGFYQPAPASQPMPVPAPPLEMAPTQPTPVAQPAPQPVTQPAPQPVAQPAAQPVAVPEPTTTNSWDNFEW